MTFLDVQINAPCVREYVRKKRITKVNAVQIILVTELSIFFTKKKMKELTFLKKFINIFLEKREPFISYNVTR